MAQINRRSFLAAAGAIATMAAAGHRASAEGTPSSTGNPGDLAYRSVSELRAMLDARQVSARELLEHAIARIEANDPQINAVVVRDFEHAHLSANAADAALARGERRPLLGIPMTVKEAFNVAGMPTTWGLPMGRGWRPTEDAVAVARLKAAGAIVLGKTNLATAVADWQSFNVIYGTTNNPWDLGRTPGGSSGGSAAALAAGYVPLELGSDISGSLRVPAHSCGVFAHKPSSYLVPQRGHTPPRSPALPTDLSSGLGVCGPMARNAADLAAALDVLAGPDDDEAAAYHLSLPPARHVDLHSYRALVLDAHPLLPVANEIRGVLDRFAEHLTAAGVAVSRSSTLLPDLAKSARLHTRMVKSFISFGLPPEFFRQIRESDAALAPDDDSLKAWRIRGPLMSHHDWMSAELERAQLRQQWRTLFKEFDVVLCPPFSVPAFPHDHLEDQEKRVIDIDGTAFPYPSLIVWATLATPPGLPATVMPIGRTRTGLPIGMQIIGGFLDDKTTLKFAELIEREFGGFTPPPNYKT